jgi:hypothetical protein
MGVKREERVELDRKWLAFYRLSGNFRSLTRPTISSNQVYAPLELSRNYDIIPS